MKPEGGPKASSVEAKPGNDDNTQYLSTQGLFIVVGTLAVALVLGYLLLNKLINISREEDCALGGRYNCAAVEIPR